MHPDKFSHAQAKDASAVVNQVNDLLQPSEMPMLQKLKHNQETRDLVLQCCLHLIFHMYVRNAFESCKVEEQQ